MKGNATIMVTKIAMIFGTNTRVISWIWVSAWNSEMTTPTSRPTSISGAETSTSVVMASRATSRTSGPVISVLSCSFSGSAAASDRHPQDFLVGLDHLVAHRDQRLDRDLGLGHGGDHVDQVGLAGRHGGGLGVGLLAGVDHRAERFLDEAAEARPRIGA